jgi:hypothetical protein
MICGAVVLSVVSASSVHLVDVEPGSLEGMTRQQLKNAYARLDRQVPSFTGPIVLSLMGAGQTVGLGAWLVEVLQAAWMPAIGAAAICVGVMAGAMVLSGAIVWLHNRIKERAPLLARLDAIRERLDRMDLDERWPDEAAPPTGPMLPPSFGSTPRPALRLAMFP